jgi:DNA (cytosine-5)-methyltransferase 1
MKKLKVLDLFSGIGGFSLGLESTGMFETAAFCEIDPFCAKVLSKHWPNVPLYNDVTKLKGEQLGKVDLITGGFPCQDLSSAGYQKGIGEGTRSGLFREMLRLAEECGRPFILFENVSRLLSGPQENKGEWFYEFLNELAKIGYDAEWFCITAASLGAPHERDRIWIVAIRVYEEHTKFSNSCWGKDKPGVVRTLNGVSKQMDRLGALGNSVFVPIVMLLGHAIGNHIFYKG